MSRLSDVDEERIEVLIQSWSSAALKWDLLVAACENELGIKTTRQALSRRERIKNALKIRKQELKAPSLMPRAFSDIDEANDRIARLTQRVSELEKAQSLLIEQFARWSFNAKVHGLTIGILDQPIPTFDLN